MKYARPAIVIIILGTIVHFLLLITLPDIICIAAMNIISKKAGGVNRIIHAQQPTAEHNPVVNSSPDLLYSACSFDISEGPVEISAIIPETYWSVSGYTSSTDNFFVINNKNKYKKKIRVILTREDITNIPSSGKVIIKAPTDKGVIIIRILVPASNKLKSLRDIQKRAVCISI